MTQTVSRRHFAQASLASSGAMFSAAHSALAQEAGKKSPRPATIKKCRINAWRVCRRLQLEQSDSIARDRWAHSDCHYHS